MIEQKTQTAIITTSAETTTTPINHAGTVSTVAYAPLAEHVQTVVYIADSPVQRAALELFDLGFNIGPTKQASKMPYLWRGLLGTRIERKAIPTLFYNSGMFVLPGRLSMNLVILDADNRQAAAHQAAEFQRRGIKPWIVNTARGQHFWFLCADGELANITDGKGWQLWGSNHYCLVPPSVHDTGMIYEWAAREGDLPPTLSISQLDWLPLKLRADKRRVGVQICEPTPLDCLSKSTRDFIDNGAPEHSRNTRLFNAACDMHGNEFPEAEAEELLADAATKSGLPYREVTRTIKSAYSTHRTPAKRSKPTPPMPTWGRALAWAQHHQWVKLHAGTIACAAQTARAVFLALCERSRRDASDVFRASRREVAELANTDQKTAERAITCLMAEGYILARGYTANKARLMAFSKKVLQETPSNTNWSVISGTKCNTQRSEVYADVFRSGALGKTAERIWRAMLPPNKPASKAEIARRASCDRATVTRVLSADGLPKWGLATEIKPRLWTGNPADERYLSEVAIKSGTAGKAKARNEKHATERAAYVSGQILRAKLRWDRGQGDV